MPTVMCAMYRSTPTVEYPGLQSRCSVQAYAVVLWRVVTPSTAGPLRKTGMCEDHLNKILVHPRAEVLDFDEPNPGLITPVTPVTQ